MINVLKHFSFADDAIQLLAPGWAGPCSTATGGVVVTIEPTARVLAPWLAAMAGGPAVVWTLDGDRCALWLVRPDGRQIGPTEGSDAFLAAELATAISRFARPRGARVARVLADRTLPATERYRQTAKLLGVPAVEPETLRDTPGVLAVWESEAAVRRRLPVDGHGAWIVPVQPNLCLVVSDGSGPVPQPRTLGVALKVSGDAAPPALGLAWGASPGLWAVNGGVDMTFDRQPSQVQVTPTARRIAEFLGRPELEPGLADVLGRPLTAAQKVTMTAGLMGIAGLPVGATVEQLAEWAAAQDGAIHVPAPSGTTLSPRLTGRADLIHRFRRRRRIRRLRGLVLVLMVVSAGGALYSFDRASPVGFWSCLAALMAFGGTVNLATRLLHRTLPGHPQA